MYFLQPRLFDLFDFLLQVCIDLYIKTKSNEMVPLKICIKLGKFLKSK